MNAANEVAVGLFLRGSLTYGQITVCVRAVLDEHQTHSLPSVAAVLEADRWARTQARAWAESHGGAA
ncbi:MAG: 1-deoxy-D-xylulose-5-phosphate reductoisomerase, partial [Pseudomonadota bacterium]